MRKTRFTGFAKVLSLVIFFCVSVGYVFPQENPADSVVLKDVMVIGYATGSLSTVSGAVSRIGEADMNKTLVVSPLDAIRGRVAGMLVSPLYNGPTVLSPVRIRGTTSLTGGNDPLIIIDGVFGNISTLSSVYPADIESFTILKDASETAQYGSRGAAGVIVVTTKKGGRDSLAVIYNGGMSVDRFVRNLEMLSGDEFRRIARERNLKFTDLDNNTDFIKEMTTPALIHRHHIAVSNGGNASNYRVSAGFIDRNGVIKGNRYRNFTTKIDIHQSALENRFSFDVGMFGSLSQKNHLNDFQKTFYSAAAFNPTFPNHRNTKTNQWDQISYASQIINPLSWLEVDDDEDNALVNMHAGLAMFITDKLKLSALGSYTYTMGEHSQYLPTYVEMNGQAYSAIKKSEHLMGNLMLNYKQVKNRHYIDLLALAEVQRETRTGFCTTVTGFTNDHFGYHNLQAGATPQWEGTASYYEDPALVSFMGRANYVFDKRYIATLNMRVDGSSKVGKDNKWGLFPSASVAWAMHEEEFMAGARLINQLKLRAGYGLSGNQDAIDSYTSMQLMKPNGITSVNGQPTVTLGTIRNANPNLTWEVKHTFDAGIDMAMADNRIFLKADYYHSKTRNLLYLYQVSVPPFAYNTLLANLGAMQNNGLEISLGVVPIIRKDMQLDLNATITTQRNKLLSLDGIHDGQQMRAPQYISVADLYGAGMHGGYNHIVYNIVGYPLGVFYLPKCTGLETDSKGRNRYAIADLNGGGVSLEDGEDRYVAGQVMPKVLLGTNISFRYRQLDLSVQVNGAFGHKIYNGTSLTYMNMSSFPDYNVLRQAPQQNIYDVTATDYWLEKGDYVNIDYLTIGWNIPLKWLRKNRQSVRLTLSATNLASLTKYSGLTPMINSLVIDRTLGIDDKRTYPVSRTYTVGIDIKL